jgi:hypothetical protein
MKVTLYTPFSAFWFPTEYTVPTWISYVIFRDSDLPADSPIRWEILKLSNRNFRNYGSFFGVPGIWIRKSEFPTKPLASDRFALDQV